MRNYLIIFVLSMMVAKPVFSQTVAYSWVGGENGSWQSADSFSPRGNPGPEDDVLLPVGIVVKLDAVNEAEWTAFNNIRCIRPNDNSTLEVNVGDKDCYMYCAFTYQADGGRNRGTLIKKGTGSLWLMSARSEFGNSDYYANFDIVEGAVKLPQDAVAGSTVKLGNISISNNASFFTLATSGTALTYTFIRELWGAPDSVVTNTALLSNSSNQVLYSNGDKVSVFAGKLCAPVRWRGAGYVHFTGTDNTTESTFTQSDNKGRGFSGPYAGVLSFGKAGEISSIGKSGEVYARENGGAFKYLGEGEETDVTLNVGSVAATPYPAYLSGGECGGLIWTGLWQPISNPLQQRLVICGDGMKTNVMKGAIQSRHYDGEYYSFFIRKQGKGTWRIEDSSKGVDSYYQMRGVWGVDEGKLQFTSLAEKGFVSSLGLATELFQDYCGTKDETRRVPYAFILGGDLTEGTLEYVGNVDEFCSERPIWLYGDGVFENNGSSKIRFRGVSSVVDGVSSSARSVKFTLKGDSVAENEILDITDSVERPVSVVKEGAGTWVLGGEQSFRGSLDVKGGKLIVRRPERYTWHRWTITSKEGTEGSANNYYQMQEFAVFDRDGMRQNFGLTLNNSYASIQPGQVSYGTDKRPVVNGTGVDLDCLFDDIKSKDGSNGWNGTMREANVLAGYQTPVRSNPYSWIPIVMRLSESANPITSYDIVYFQTSDHIRSVTSYFVDGSVDGVHWDRLSTVDTVGNVGANHWQYNGATKANNERSKAHENGCPIESAPKKLFDVFNNVKCVSVDKGAELVFEGDITVPALSFDCEAEGGIFRGCKFAGNGGFVNLLNVPGGQTEIDFGWSFNECTGVENIANWKVMEDGIETSRYTLGVKDGNRIVAVRTGLRLIIR